ncbi:LexA family transcriptional regulator [Prevotella merdae]|uniref:LexA family transcriptional regulator n=1 Tax=Prevotella merdae TaxID=2079531 RepID=UPI0035686BD2
MDKKGMLSALIQHFSAGNKAQFAKLVGVTPQTISTWLSRNTFDADKIFAFCEGINGDWLLSGKGDMIKESHSIKLSEDGTGIPLIPVEAMAGCFTGSQTVLLQECERYVVPAFKNADFLIRVSGDSMVPRYFSGDMVACKMLSLADIFFQWGKVYVLDTDQGALIKKVERGSSNDTITLVSENQAYQPFELLIRQVYHIAIVMGLIRTE